MHNTKESTIQIEVPGCLIDIPIGIHQLQLVDVK
jgi:hypothetical protein